MSSVNSGHTVDVKPMASPAAPTSATSNKHVQPVYCGDLLELYKIFLVNLLLNIVTFGIYSFWAKTRVRRYLWQSIDIDGDRLEYTGTGKELFLGFLKFIFLFFVPAVVILVLIQLLIADSDVTLAAQSGMTILAGQLGIMAMFWALRYRLSRTEWRSIRAGLGGSAPEYMLRVMMWEAANMVTLFLLTPVADVSIRRYVMRHVHAGGTQMAVSPRGVGALYPSFLLAWIVPIVGVTLLVVTQFATFITLMAIILEWVGWANSPPEADAALTGASLAGSIVVMVLGVIAVFLLSALAAAWYRAAYYRHVAGEIRLDTIRFKVAVDGMSLMVLTLVNQLVMLVSLGLGKPIVWHMTAKFICDKVQFGPRQALDSFKQNEMTRPKTGEGLAEGLDVGGFV